MPILFIQTGGTIDKDYPRIMASYGFEITEPAVKKFMKRVKPSFKYRVLEVFKKDSLDLTDADRTQLLQICQEVAEKQIIITHGTDTMVTTAAVLDKIHDKVIILTGALLPAIHAESDALFNVGTAVGAIEHVQPGVYIAMSGKLFPWRDCVKSSKSIKFVSKKS